MYLRDNNYPLPSGAVLMSPWVGKCPLIAISYVQVSLHHRSHDELRIMGIQRRL